MVDTVCASKRSHHLFVKLYCAHRNLSLPDIPRLMHVTIQLNPRLLLLSILDRSCLLSKGERTSERLMLLMFVGRLGGLRQTLLSQYPFHVQRFQLSSPSSSLSSVPLLSLVVLEPDRLQHPKTGPEDLLVSKDGSEL